MENSDMNKTKWDLDPAHSEIGFKVKHLMITNVKGLFKEFNTSVETTGEDFSSAKINFKMNPSSVDTGDVNRDGHLKSPDFFDVEHYKEIAFVGDKLEKIDSDTFKLYGDLSIKGITKRIGLDVEFGGVMNDPWGNHKAGFTINGKINRKEWGLNWNAGLETGGVLVSDDVRINCEVQLIRK
jgi:polyisoprenoid-binding protein YceI